MRIMVPSCSMMCSTTRVSRANGGKAYPRNRDHTRVNAYFDWMIYIRAQANPDWGLFGFYNLSLAIEDFELKI